MKNKLIVVALLLANVLPISAMSNASVQNVAEMQAALKTLLEYGAFKAGFKPKIGADLSRTYEGLTQDGKLVQVRFTKNGALDKSFGSNGVETGKNVGINYNLE